MLGIDRLAEFGKHRAATLSLALPKLEQRAAFDLCTTMTLLLLLLYSSDTWRFGVVLTILSVLAFIFGALKRDPRFWFVVTVIVFMGNYYNWFQADNHEFLIGYWCLALFCVLHTDEPENALAIVARWLIGLSFLFAVFWKAVSADYLNATFFQYALLLDERFTTIASNLGGLTATMNELNQAAQRALVNYDSLLTVVQLQSATGVLRLARFMTWWAFLLELLVAVAFLWPVGKFISQWRDFFLLFFLLSTYSVAPVIGFGWILTIMGFVQCERRLALMPLLYMLAFVVLQAYRFPWSAVF